MASFLLEIGTAEIPARFIEPALEDLRKLAASKLEQERIAYQSMEMFGTPRRLALYAKGLPERQPPLVREVKGPAVKVAFDSRGNLTKAGLGFAKSQGVDPGELVKKTVGPVEYVFAVHALRGRETKEVLGGIIPALISGLSFPKFMRWGTEEVSFVRPIRWLVALLDDQVVPVQFAGCASDRVTRGHRELGAALSLACADEYCRRLGEVYVVADQQKRREIILAQVNGLAQKAGGRIPDDPGLLSEVTNLVEYPTALLGTFPPEYLNLPQAVLVTTMREHQRFFPVVAADGGLMPCFITVRNGSDQHLDTVRAGNERVLKARLADALFFYNEDLRVPLADRVDNLQKIVYLEGLGNLLDRTGRIGALASKIGGALGMAEGDRELLARACHLAKADLTTSMVYEFPELQGVMGQEYARANGQDPAVALAVYEHYLPRFAGDALPVSRLGRILSLADKFDHVTAIFSQNLIPNGSQDPYALRRSVLGICHIILSGGLALELGQLIKWAYEGLRGFTLKLDFTQLEKELTEFFRQRIRSIFIERGLAYDTVDGVLATGFDDLPGAWSRGRALEDFRSSPGYAGLMTVFTRPHNLSRGADTGPVDPHAFSCGEEEELYRHYRLAGEKVKENVARGAYTEALLAMAALCGPLDSFFNSVMVMVDDEKLRSNRLALLKEIAGLAARVADLSRLSG